MSELERLIQALRSEGRVESVGRFSVDPARALRMLGSYALADPQSYLVHLVEAAVLNGAGRVEVQRLWQGCVVEADGPPYQCQELRDLIPGLVAGRWQTDHRLHPLALAVAAALGSLARQVVVASAARGQLAIACYDGQGVEVLQSEAAATPRQRVEVRFRRPRGLRSLLTGHPESGVLRAQCRHCPVDLRLHGAPVADPVRLAPCLVLGILRHPQIPLRFQEDTRLFTRWSSSPGDFAAVLTLGWQGTAQGLWVQHGGRLFPMDSDLGPSVTAFVVARGLRTDLGRASLARDERMEALLEGLRQEALQMRLHLADRFDSLDARHRARAVAHLRYLAQELRAAGQAQLAQEIMARLGPAG